jgi:hypothetical protein
VTEIARDASDPSQVKPSRSQSRQRASDDAYTERSRRAREDDYEEESSSRSEDDVDDADDEQRRRRRKRRRRAKEAVRAPAIALLVVGCLGLILGGVYIVRAATGAGPDPAMKNVPGYEAGFKLGSTLAAVAGPIWGIAVALGAVQMLMLRSRGAAMTAAIFALLPCNHCCVPGLPIGIWALIVLAIPEVKSGFR